MNPDLPFAELGKIWDSLVTDAQLESLDVLVQKAADTQASNAERTYFCDYRFHTYGSVEELMSGEFLPHESGSDDSQRNA